MNTTECQLQANGVCDVPSEKMENNLAITHRQVNSSSLQAFTDFSKIEKLKQESPSSKFQLLFGIRKHTRIFHLHVSDSKDFSFDTIVRQKIKWKTNLWLKPYT